MKRYSKRPRSHTAINAAKQVGTVYYKMSIDQITDVLDAENSNLIFRQAIKLYGFDALDIERMYGSVVYGDYLYLCKTDGQEILIGDRYVDPEEALEEYHIESLTNYIQEATDEIIHQNITDYELNESEIDLDEIAISLLEDGFSFETIVHEAYDLDLVQV